MLGHLLLLNLQLKSHFIQNIFYLLRIHLRFLIIHLNHFRLFWKHPYQSSTNRKLVIKLVIILAQVLMLRNPSINQSK